MQNFIEWFQNMLPFIFTAVVIPCLGLLTAFLVALLQKKKVEVTERIKNEQLSKYVGMLFDTVEKCVIVTNNTYVNALKEKNAFDKNAQINAFNMTKDAVLQTLSKEALDFLNMYYNDLTLVIDQYIESAVVTAINRA